MVPDPLVVNELTVNTQATFNGIIDCPGGAMNANCFGLAVCPDLSGCEVTARTLTLNNDPLGSARLQIGAPGHTTDMEFILGDRDHIPLDGYLGTKVQWYVEQSILNSRDSISIGVGNGITVGDPAFQVQVFGSPSIGMLFNAPTTSIQMITGGGFSVQEAGSSTISLASNTGLVSLTGSNVQATAHSILEDTDVFHVRASGSAFSWILTERSASSGLQCNASIPHTAAEPAVPQIRIGAQLRLSEEVSILTENSKGRIDMSGIELCTGQLMAQDGVPLLIKSNTSITLDAPTVDFAMGTSLSFEDISVEGSMTVTNAAVAGNVFEDDRVYNSGSIPVGIGILGAGHFFIDDQARVNGNLRVDGNVEITGTINGQAISGTGPCCDSSDERVKEHVKPMRAAESWDRILSLRPVEYKFKKEYQDVDKWVGDKVKRGFLAQKVKQVIPQAVHTVEKKVGNIHYPDFHLIQLHQIVPDMVAALQHAHQKIRDLEDKVESLHLSMLDK